jgi:hypothetical protein
MDRYLKGAWWFGIIGGAFCGLAFVVFYFVGAEPISFTEIFGYIIIPIFVFLGIKNFKDNMNDKVLSFGQGMTVGFFIYSLLALISAVVIFIMLHVDPAVFNEYKEATMSLLEERKEEIMQQLGSESYEATLKSMSGMTIFDVVLNDFLRKLIPGLFFTIILSIILKNSKV